MGNNNKVAISDNQKSEPSTDGKKEMFNLRENNKILRSYIEKKDTKNVKKLIKEYYDNGIRAEEVFWADLDGSYISYLVKNNDVEMVKLLLDNARGCRQRGYANVSFGPNQTKVETLCEYAKTPEMLSLLRSYGARTMAEQKLDDELNWAVFKGRLSIVRKLLAEGADVNTEFDDGFTCLMTACIQYSETKEDVYYEIAKRLIKAGADVNHREYMLGGSVLTRCLNTELLKLLLENGADPNIQNYDGETVAHFIATHNDLEKIKLLAQYGARFDIKTNDGEDVWDNVMYTERLGFDVSAVKAYLFPEYGHNISPTVFVERVIPS